MPDSVDHDLNEARLQLEVERFRFEQQKFDAEDKSRVEQLSKLRAERQKAEFEAQDLRAPFFQKPIFVTALFQGIALVIAVVSALISLGGWNALRDAAIAKTEKASALADAAKAKEKQVEAEDKLKEANTASAKAIIAEGKAQAALNIAERAKESANAAAENAQRDAELEPVRQILKSLREAHYYPPQTLHQDIDREKRRFLEIRLLFDALETSEPRIREERVRFLKDYVLQTSEPPGVRLGVLSVLYEESRQPRFVAELSPDHIRGEFIEVATSRSLLK